jgi:hypothetical protein
MKEMRKMNDAEPKPINQDEQLFAVGCANCNEHIFRFSKNLLEEYGVIFLQCPECWEETKVTYNGLNGIDIKKVKHY